MMATKKKEVADEDYAGPNESFPISDPKSVTSAWDLAGHAENPDAVREAIKGIAKRKGPAWEAALPTTATQEEGLSLTLVMEEVAKPVVLQEATADNGGIMRIKAPFYVGGSVSNAPGFGKKIVWQESALPATITQAKARIAAGQQVITSYARHAHALSKDHLPIARVVDVEQEGNVGYATLDVFPVEPTGKHVQALVQAGALTAMSLRTNDYKLVPGKLDGEGVLLCEAFALQGLDFAPDGPAQPTYGIQILSQEAVVTVDEPEPVSTTKNSRKENKLPEEGQPLTLEDVRKDAAIIEKIEAPLRQEIASLKKDLTTLQQAADVQKRDVAIRSYAEQSGNPEEFTRVLTELCQEQNITTENGVSQIVAPLLVQELARRAANPVAPEKSKKETLLELFGAKATEAQGNGVVTQEETVEAPLIQESNAEVTASGLIVPENY